MSEPHDHLSDQRVIATCLVVLTVIAVGAVLVPLRPVLVPLLLAVLFTWCLKPIIAWQMHTFGMPRLAAIAGTAVLGLVILSLLGLFFAVFVAQVNENLQRYEQRTEQLIRDANKVVPLERFGLPADPKKLLTVPEETRKRIVQAVLFSSVDVISGGSLVLIFVLFMLFGGPTAERPPDSLLGEVETRARRYLLQMFGFSALTGVLVGFTLAVLGVDFAYAFGFLAFLLNFIPTVGPVIATLLPLPVVVLDSDLSIPVRVLAFALPAAIQCVLGVVQPRVQGEGQNLHPVTTMAALVFFGSIWGILGAALAVPLMGVVRIILERIPTTRPVAAWLAGRVDPLPAECPPPKAGG